MFPEKNVPFTNSDGATLSYELGTLIATAAASGLAGFFHHCSKLLGNSEYFKNKKHMRLAFTAISLGTDGKYPRVKHFFEETFKSYVNQDADVGEAKTPNSTDISQLV